MAKDKEKSGKKLSGGVKMKSMFSKLVKTLKKDKTSKDAKTPGGVVWWVRAFRIHVRDLFC
jgi:hypothetical protein